VSQIPAVVHSCGELVHGGVIGWKNGKEKWVRFQQ
jgi:hypothetical protein